ncbi:MAG: GDSL-type esterase/lipase family protein [Moraxellaceae bacterium]|nr:GDSL-type esterase/lipase family protein [Moraxellaceae bacterium]
MKKTIARQLLMIVTAGAMLGESAWALDCNSPRWVSAWQASPADARWLGLSFDFFSLNLPMGPNQSYRQVFSPLGSGSTVRLKFSNRHSNSPLIIRSTNLARQAVGAAIVAGTLTPVRFNNGQSAVTVPAGQDILSDPVNFSFRSLEKLSVSIATGNTRTDFVPTGHMVGMEHSYVTEPGAGDRTTDIEGGAFRYRTTRRHLLTGMDVLAPAHTAAVVTLGDSITDGYQSVIGANQRYPDFLKRRIDGAGLPYFVVNAGIAGNRVATDNPIQQFGVSAVNRLDADVLKASGVSDVILLEGINDIGQDYFKFLDYWNRYSKIINAYQTLITSLQARGLKVMQGTLTPSGSALNPSYSGPFARQLRQDVNWWIRNKSPADSIIDFDAAVRNPSNHAVIDDRYDSGDGLHFNAEGYARLAAAVDLGKLQGSKCRG